jgi:hypothetical protein
VNADAQNVASVFGRTSKVQPAKQLTSNISAQTLGVLSVALGELAAVIDLEYSRPKLLVSTKSGHGHFGLGKAFLNEGALR